MMNFTSVGNGQTRLKAVNLNFILVIFLFLYCSLADAQVMIDSSQVKVSGLHVDNIVNDPETMNIECFHLEFSIAGYQNVDSLAFEVNICAPEEDTTKYAFNLPVVERDGNYYVMVNDMQYLIENGNVQILMDCKPIPLREQIDYSISGTDKFGLPITKVKFNPF